MGASDSRNAASAWGRARTMAGWWLAVWMGLAGVLGVGLWLGGGVASAQAGEFPGQGTDWGSTRTVSVASLKIPQKAWEHFAKANAAADGNRVEEFERETAKALEIAPGFAEVYLLRARWKVLNRRFDAAVADVLEAERLQPGVNWSGVILAQAYNGAHRFHDAVLVLNSLHGWEGDAWQAKYERARAEIGLRDAGSALRWSEQTMAAAPVSFTEVHLLRANALVLARQWSSACREMEMYLADDKVQAKRGQVLAMLDYTRGMAAGLGGAEVNLASR